MRNERRKALTILGRIDVVFLRNISQLGFSLFLLYRGWRFFWFVRHFASGGVTPVGERPASVEGFLPLSALIALRSWLDSGQYDTVHPAGLAILLAILLTSWLWRKGFCSWICPLGALSEGLERLGRLVWGEPSRLPGVVDLLLLSLKYLLLLFFLQAILLDMSSSEAAQFLGSPYNKIADVKMLYFFTQIGAGTAVVIGLLLAFSTIIANPWCRYLCPYGALLGLLSLFGSLRVARAAESCSGCRACSNVCPNLIDVASRRTVNSPECTGCLRCIAACPQRNALDVKASGRTKVAPWAFGALLLTTFIAMLAIGRRV